MEKKEFVIDKQNEYIETIIPLKNIFLRTASMSFLIIYILSPVDFIPDIILPFGFLDDIVSLFFLYKTGIKTWRENRNIFFKIFLFLIFLTVVSIILILYFFMK